MRALSELVSFYVPRTKSVSRTSGACTALLVAIFAMTWAAPGAMAQTVFFSGSQSVIPTSKLNDPLGVAVDQSGNVYIADAANNRILKETPSGGTFTESTVATEQSPVVGVAVDPGGNVYFLSLTAGTAFKAAPGPSGYTVSTIPTSGLNRPSGIAVDASGNVYIADGTGGGRLLKETPASGSYKESFIGSGLEQPADIAVDRNGNVYTLERKQPASDLVVETFSKGSYVQSRIAPTNLSFNPGGITVDAKGEIFVTDLSLNEALKVAVSGSSFTTSVIPTAALNDALYLAVDSTGDLFIAEGGTLNEVVKESSATVNFGRTNIASKSTTMSLLFTFQSSDTIGAPTVLTEGAKGFDFADAGTGTCTTNGASHIYTAGDVCSVDVVFDPTVYGARSGAVELSAKAGTVLATGYVQGVGVGPQVGYAPGGALTLPVTGLTTPSNGSLTAMVSDSFGNLYIAQSASGVSKILKETLGANGYVSTTVASDLTQPSGVAVDGAGNVYYIDESSSQPFVAAPAPGGGFTVSQLALAQSGTRFTAIAVDGAGNIYLADEAKGILKETPVIGGGYAQSVVNATFWANQIAVDAAGNLYFPETFGTSGGGIVNQTLQKAIFAKGSYTLSPVSSLLVHALGVTVDGNGNVYTFDQATENLVKETFEGGLYIQSNMQFPTMSAGLSMDGKGNIYGLTSQATVVQLNFVDAPILSFAATPIGQQSSDSPKLAQLLNLGNAPLSFPVLNGKNPSLPSDFAFVQDAFQGCPLVNSEMSAAGSLQANASCNLEVIFAPVANGTASGLMVITDNNLNAAMPGFATQTVTLNGGGAKTTPRITWPTPAPISFGTALSATQLNATASTPGTFQYTPAAGTVPAAGAVTLTALFTPTDSKDFTTATATNSLIVTQTKITPKITWPTPAPITFGTALSATQLDATASTAGTFRYTPAAGSVPAAGTVMLTAIFTPTDSSDFTTATAKNSLVVNKGAANQTASTVTVAGPSQSSSSTVTLAAIVQMAGTVTGTPTGTPTGTVTFFDGKTQLGTATLNFNVANFTTPALSNGTHSITAVYAGDSKFATATSAPFSIMVNSFTIGVPSTGGGSAGSGSSGSGLAGSGSSPITSSPGGAANFTLPITPTGGSSFAAPVMFSVTGLPPGATQSALPARRR